MKKLLRFLIPFIMLIICVASLSSCIEFGITPGEPVDTWQPLGEDVTLFKKGEESDFVFVNSITGFEMTRNAAKSMKSELTALGFSIPADVVSESTPEGDAEIILGKSERMASVFAAALLEKSIPDGDDGLHWVFYYRDGKLAIVASSVEAYKQAELDFIRKYVKGDDVILPDSLKDHISMTKEAYNEWYEEQERIAAEALKAERDSLLLEVKPLYGAQRDEMSASKPFGTSTKNIGVSSWAPAPTTPTEEHPRVFITEENLPLVRQKLKEDNNTNEWFKSRLDTVHETNGVLGAPRKGNDGRSGLHNYNKSLLELIQIKALGYLTEGHALFGYQAILYMKNYLLTLDIQYIESDQCREYGNVMFTAALVYDWCYDLLTDEDKEQLIAGVEKRTASGYCGDPSYTSSGDYKRKMEVGFPPSGQSSVCGHGSEGQILRNYLAAAIAFYGDNDSWWDFVASRVYDDFVGVRNFYFQSGISQQGSGLYVKTRHISDLFSAWLLKVATGDMPYVNLDKTVRSFFGYECAPDLIFTDGDGSNETKNQNFLVDLAYISAYLFEDEAMLKWADDTMRSGSFGADTNYMTSALFVALRGLADIEPAEDRYEGMELIQYNGYPVGQYVARQKWNDINSAAVFMKMKAVHTANHEHGDAGTFEIYYKGMLSSDGGNYALYGTAHTSMYHQATISHNGLIIFNPSKWDFSSSSTSVKWYSGSQKKPDAPKNLEALLSSGNYNVGIITGHQHAYADKEQSVPLYAYIAGDITKAYSYDTVDYVGRRMLTVFTGDESYPMVMFVYDDITSDKESYEKRFLLQISSCNAPDVDTGARTIATENVRGRLVLTCLTESVRFNLAGGRSEGTYKATESKNFLINGHQCLTGQNDDGHWGRVEIIWDKETKDAKFVNVLYVTDKGNNTGRSILPISNATGLEGGVYNSEIVALFATSRTGAKEPIYCDVPGNEVMDYYVSGVSAGKWWVTVNGKDHGTYTATEDGGLLTFSAPGGTVVISPLK